MSETRDCSYCLNEEQCDYAKMKGHAEICPLFIFRQPAEPIEQKEAKPKWDAKTIDAMRNRIESRKRIYYLEVEEIKDYIDLYDVDYIANKMKQEVANGNKD